MFFVDKLNKQIIIKSNYILLPGNKISIVNIIYLVGNTIFQYSTLKLFFEYL